MLVISSYHIVSPILLFKYFQYFQLISIDSSGVSDYDDNNDNNDIPSLLTELLEDVDAFNVPESQLPPLETAYSTVRNADLNRSLVTALPSVSQLPRIPKLKNIAQEPTARGPSTTESPMPFRYYLIGIIDENYLVL